MAASREALVKFGHCLADERKKRGLTLDEVHAKLKISKELLAHIESGEIDEMPNPLYYSLHGKAYAELLRIDFTRTIEQYEEEIRETEFEQIQKAKQEKQQRLDEQAAAGGENAGDKLSRIQRQLLYAVGLLFAVVAIWLVTDNVIRQESSSVTSAPGAADSLYGQYNWNVPGYKSGEKLRLTVTASQESWAEIHADGDTVIRRNLTPGRTYRVEANYRMNIVKIGIPTAVAVTLNGQPVNLKDTLNRISEVEITQLSFDSILFANQLRSDENVPLFAKPQTRPAQTPTFSTDESTDSM
jgi:transcriptional regulator with XRE-family HTH domain